MGCLAGIIVFALFATVVEALSPIFPYIMVALFLFIAYKIIKFQLKKHEKDIQKMGIFRNWKKEYQELTIEKECQENNLKNEIEELKRTLKEKSTKIFLLEQQVEEKSCEIEKNSTEGSRNSEYLHDLENKTKKLKKENDSLTKTVTAQKSTIDNLNTNICEIKNEQEKILTSEKNRRNKLEKYIQEKEEQIREQREQIKSQSEQIAKKDEQILEKDEQIKKIEVEQLREKEEYNSLKSKNFILGPGKYKGGIDIPYGEYNLKILSGFGWIETNKPDDIFFQMSKNVKDRKAYGYIEKYRGLSIGEKTVLKISDSAEVQFSIRNEYNFRDEIDSIKNEYENKKRELEKEYADKHSRYRNSYNKIRSEIESLKTEMKILNNEAIEKYYVLSDYDGITSQDCKNELALLKSEEKKLRDSNKDVIVTDVSEKKKVIERSIRQILRNFNSDCNNHIMNIRVKNIDIIRNRIQKSYDTLNTLYSIDGVSLSKAILELKLKQATLMYTYELKYQQEKDIQQAIKEKMIEEAKAEREIEEQKKKIEKDLQQHLGEVNRLIKYLQKSQIDAERQLYIDKIKELEDKIKILENDKETVVEREANAKAGFVYIISNIGSFGEDIYKIGMTRRLEPMDRIRELSSASVPFEFDVHAMIFSSDAPELETCLHRHFSDRAVNKVNPRKEFYHVNIDEIEEVVKENYNDTVKFTKIPIAAEYRQSLELSESAD